MASAQLSEAPKSQPVDLNIAGQHIEKAGKMRSTAMFVTLGGVLIGAMTLAGDSENSTPAVGLMGAGFIVGWGINLGANKNERKAGRILQGLE